MVCCATEVLKMRQDRKITMLNFIVSLKIIFELLIITIELLNNY